MPSNPTPARFVLPTLFNGGTSSGLTDGQLLERFATGDGPGAEAAYAALVERHAAMVFRTCRGILRDDHEARDAAQATFLVLFRKGRSVWVAHSLGPWLHRVACRAAHRARIGATRRRAIERELVDVAGPAHDQADLVAAVHEELDRLPDRFRVPIVLCDLEGYTCEEAARQVGCPIGTIGSRLARGRDRLRSRLIRRGLAPAVGAWSVGFAKDAAAIPWIAATARGAGTSPAVARLAQDVIRSSLMIKFTSLGIASVCGVGLLMGWSGSGLHGQTPVNPPKPVVPPTPQEYPFVTEERFRNYVMGYIGNLPSPNPQETTPRQVVVYEDGTAKLWSKQQHDPLTTLRQDGPIRRATIIDQASLLITVADDSVKFWDALNGTFRKQLDGQTIKPFSSALSTGEDRFLTISKDQATVTVWNATTLEPVRVIAVARQADAAGLAANGRTVAVFWFGAEAAVELWDVTLGRSFATLRPPSPALAGVLIEEGNRLDDSSVKHNARFWEIADALAPSALGR